MAQESPPNSPTSALLRLSVQHFYVDVLSYFLRNGYVSDYGFFTKIVLYGEIVSTVARETRRSPAITSDRPRVHFKAAEPFRGQFVINKIRTGRLSSGGSGPKRGPLVRWRRGAGAGGPRVAALANEVKGSRLRRPRSSRGCQINEALLCNKEITRIAYANPRSPAAAQPPTSLKTSGTLDASRYRASSKQLRSKFTEREYLDLTVFGVTFST
ncbi:hypothetical protein EVAR_52178_1 [Eumeta japonica]|uniref:Uncharacterized protein n=1 Tax=Eumeta variegata TaxID=151549 RepID=A0A4C1YCC3_EUMVA|nr:hypothetical protein EVAR_52178_1 [Eumeta japonica]